MGLSDLTTNIIINYNDLAVLFPFNILSRVLLLILFYLIKKKNRKESEVNFRKLYSECILRGGFITNENFGFSNFNFAQFSMTYLIP